MKKSPVVLFELTMVTGKLVHLRDSDETDYIVALPLEVFPYHYNVVDYAETNYSKELEVLGGCIVIHVERRKEILISDKSADFGPCDKNFAKETLQNAIPEYKVKITD